MKRLILLLVVATMATTVYSCRETTQEKSQEALESIGEDIETNAKKAGEKIEKGAKKVVRELDEELHNTDDVNGEEAADDMN
jgi:F0F1-type ATP synthase membrane subunit b/b'